MDVHTFPQGPFALLLHCKTLQTLAKRDYLRHVPQSKQVLKSAGKTQQESLLYVIPHLKQECVPSSHDSHRNRVTFAIYIYSCMNMCYMYVPYFWAMYVCTTQSMMYRMSGNLRMDLSPASSLKATIFKSTYVPQSVHGTCFPCQLLGEKYGMRGTWQIFRHKHYMYI